jgi:hypothetical protein
MHRWLGLLTLVCALLAVSAQAAPLDPNAYTSLGTLNAASGAVTFDTDTLAVSGAFSGTGVVQSQGPGLPEIAVFTFDDLTLAGAVTLTITGSRPIALLSQGDASFHTPINVAGSSSLVSSTGAPGKLGGGAGGNGQTSSSSPQPGAGPGGGDGGFFTVDGNGEGGAFGGIYGDLSLALQAGSGGGGGLRVTLQPPLGTVNGGGGGAGGGGIEIGAIGTLTLDQTVAAFGGDGADLGGRTGGGGSGGGILVHAQAIQGTAILDAHGGSAPFLGLGGVSRGGGGRVRVDVGSLRLGQSPSANVAVGGGGVGGGVAQILTDLTIVPSGFIRELDSTGRFNETLSGFPVYQTGNLGVETGGVVAATTAVASSHDLVLAGGLVAAPLGWTLAGAAQISGFGTLAGAVSGGTTTQIAASGGTLVLGDANAANGFVFSGAVTLADGATLSLHDSDGATLQPGGNVTALGNATIDGAFVNQGHVVGPGAMGEFLAFVDDVTGAGSYAGNILFSDGFSPGASPAAVALENAVFDASATLTMELGGLAPGSEYDRLVLSGDLELDGTLDVKLIHGFAPALGDSFDLFDWNALAGAFAAVNLPALAGNAAWDSSRLYSDGSIVVIPEPATSALLAAGLALLALRGRVRTAPRAQHTPKEDFGP